MMINIEFKNINKIYQGGFQAVYDFNMSIEEGEFIVLVGPSGCGKSTMLRMIAGLEQITSGDLIISGERVNDMAPSDRDIAMVFQDYALYGNMTVYENMGFSLTVRHEDSDKIHSEVMRVADVVDLREYLNRKPGQLSGGQRQRVALGRSIARNVGILLMDEPLSNLDAKLRNKTRKELVELHRALKATIIYVTHDQVEAMTMADRIVIMNKGYIQQIGTPMELYSTPENIFVGGFIGSPPMNFVEGEIKGDRFIADGISLKIPEKRQSMLEGYNGKRVILGIRPEHFSFVPSGADTAREFQIQGGVDLVEFLGADLLVYLNIKGEKMTAKLCPTLQEGQGISYGDNISLVVSMDKVHYFDPNTEIRIR